MASEKGDLTGQSDTKGSPDAMVHQAVLADPSRELKEERNGITVAS